MSARRGAMPLVRLQWTAWVMMVVVLTLGVTTALLLIFEQGQ
jgi:hypothetical protein